MSAANAQPHDSARLWAIDAAGLGAAVLLTSAAAFASLRPLLDQRDQTRATQQSLHDERERADRLRADRKALDARIALFQSDLAADNWKPQPVSQLNERLSRLTESAVSSGLTVGQLTPGAPAAQPKFTAVPIRLSARGTYKACHAFLSALNDQFRDTATLAVRLSAQTQSTQREVDFQAELRWYAAPPAPPAQPAKK